MIIQLEFHVASNLRLNGSAKCSLSQMYNEMKQEKKLETQLIFHSMLNLFRDI